MNLLVILLLAAVIAVALLLLAEGLFRFFAEWKYRHVDSGVYQPTEDPDLRFEYVPDNRFEYVYFGPPLGRKKRVVSCRINSRGFRNREFETHPANGTRRIICVGDSATFGEGVAGDETIPARLEAELNRNGDTSGNRRWEVINAGVAAYDISQKLACLKHRCLGLKPHMVILFYSLNDPQVWRGAHAGEDGRVKYPGVSTRSRIQHMVRRRLALVSRAGDWWTRNFGAFRLASTYGDRSEEWIQTRSLLREFKALSLQHGFAMFVGILPAPHRLKKAHPYHPLYRIVECFLDEEGIPHRLLFPAVEGWRDRNAVVQACDVHPSAAANQAYARYVRQELESMGLLDTDTRSATRRDG